jgi:hypothetical protein
LQIIRRTSAPTVQPAAPSIRLGRASWPENSTSDELWVVSSPKMTAAVPIPKPATGVSTSICRSTIGCSRSAGRLIAVPITAAANPIPIAHRNSASVGVVNGGMWGTASENVP